MHRMWRRRHPRQTSEVHAPGKRVAGYEISPQAYELSQQFSNPRCGLVLGCAFDDPQVYDLALVMDVVEHVEDCFSFMRRVRAKGQRTIFTYLWMLTRARFCVDGMRGMMSATFISSRKRLPLNL